jgi:hypothetical protein
MQISQHFALEEFLFSEAATRLGVDNTPGAKELANLQLTAAFMEKIRTLLRDQAIVVHSGYRSPQVNTILGGVPTSAHCRGLACDFVCPTFGTRAEVALAILASGLEYDQLILEYGWVHVSLPEAGLFARRESLTKPSRTSAYESGICS